MRFKVAAAPTSARVTGLCGATVRVRTEPDGLHGEPCGKALEPGRLHCALHARELEQALRAMTGKGKP